MLGGVSPTDLNDLDGATKEVIVSGLFPGYCPDDKLCLELFLVYGDKNWKLMGIFWASEVLGGLSLEVEHCGEVKGRNR